MFNNTVKDILLEYYQSQLDQLGKQKDVLTVDFLKQFQLLRTKKEKVLNLRHLTLADD